MKTKIVPASELNPEKSLLAKDYVEEPEKLQYGPSLVEIHHCVDCSELDWLVSGQGAVCDTREGTRTLPGDVTNDPPPKWCPLRQKYDFTVEQLRAAHEFVYVKDEDDQLAVCEMAHILKHAFPRTNGDTLGHLFDNYINAGDGCMADELVLIFEETIWKGKV
jgi:hypothetical protein